MIGSGVDISVSYMAQSKLRNACDAAVLAGRQSMQGNDWDNASEQEAEKFFDFDFPSGTHGVTDAVFDVDQDADDPAQIVGSATGTVPTSLMKIFGYNSMDISANCNAKRDLGHNDVMLVLDVTGSMNDAPSNGGGTKTVHISRSSWNNGNGGGGTGNRQGFRTSGEACIEERPSIGNSDNTFEIDDVPVNQHIVFMTDGMLDTGDQLYSAHGVKRYQQCTQGSGSEDEKHLSRFASTCSLAKSMGITVNDVVFYTADISMPRLLPWHGFVEGMSPTIDMELETAVRSQPYGNQATPPVICAEPD